VTAARQRTGAPPAEVVLKRKSWLLLLLTAHVYCGGITAVFLRSSGRQLGVFLYFRRLGGLFIVKR